MSAGPWDPTGKVDVPDMLEVLEVENLRREGRNEMRFCVAPWTRILTADLRWEEACNLDVGDELWAFDEHKGQSDRGDRRWRKSVVTGSSCVVQDCYNVVLSDGTSMIVSSGHLWLLDTNKSKSEWRRTDQLRPGLRLLRLLNTWEEDRSYESGRLGGLFDGEGSFVQRRGRKLLQISQNEGSVLDDMKSLLDRFGWEYTQNDQGSGYPDSTCKTLNLLGGMPKCAEFIGTHRPLRMLQSFDLEDIQLRRIATPEIVGVHFLGKKKTVALTTSTKTFVAEGIASHNSCPYPTHENGDQNASAYMNVDSTAWYCHGCKRKGATCIPLVAYMLDVSPMKAKRVIREAYDPSSFNIEDRDLRAEIMAFIANAEAPKVDGWKNSVISEDAVDGFLVDWASANNGWATGEGFPPCDYILERGFLPQTLDHWQFGYDEISNRIVFPVRSEAGALIGFKGRATDGREPKYLVVGDSEGRTPRYGMPRYYTGLVVFGLSEAIKHMGDRKVIIVCEGELNAIALWQMGFKNAVALNGSRLTLRQRQLIKRHADEVIFFFDFDKAGLEGMWGYEDEKGFWHEGAIDILARDCTVRLVGSHNDDAAGLMQAGGYEDVEALISGAKGHMSVVVDELR